MRKKKEGFLYVRYVKKNSFNVLDYLEKLSEDLGPCSGCYYVSIGLNKFLQGKSPKD